MDKVKFNNYSYVHVFFSPSTHTHMQTPPNTHTHIFWRSIGKRRLAIDFLILSYWYTTRRTDLGKPTARRREKVIAWRDKLAIIGYVVNLKT